MERNLRDLRTATFLLPSNGTPIGNGPLLMPKNDREFYVPIDPEQISPVRFELEFKTPPHRKIDKENEHFSYTFKPRVDNKLLCITSTKNDTFKRCLSSSSQPEDTILVCFYYPPALGLYSIRRLRVMLLDSIQRQQLVYDTRYCIGNVTNNKYDRIPNGMHNGGICVELSPRNYRLIGMVDRYESDSCDCCILPFPTALCP